jgi:hypothetical protein
VNHPPVANNDTVTTPEEQAVNINVLANDTDPDGDTLTPVLVTGPANGSVTINSDGTFHYTPNALFYGTDQFTYRANDGQAQSNLATVTVSITRVDHPPTVSASTVTGTEDTPYVFSWSDFHVNDVDSTALSIVIDSLPVAGQLQYYNGTAWVAVTLGQTISQADINAGRLCFGPDANASGFPGYSTSGFGNLAHDYAQFTYQANDTEKLSSTTTMTVDVLPVADTPLLTVGNANQGVGGVSQIVHTSWESAPNRNRNSTVLPQTTLEGWNAVMPAGDSNNHFIVWSSGDRMKDANNQDQTVYAAPGDGNNWIELANANGAGHETIGISRSVMTQAGSNYVLSFDYAGRLGYSVQYTQIGVYVDGTRIATYANTSPNTALNWQSLAFSFTGTGQAQTIVIQIESATDSNGRGAMIDDIALTEQVPLNSGYANTAIQLSPIAAALVDTDGSESLSVSMSGIPVGATLSDGVRSFTATSGTTSVSVTGWTLTALSVTPPTNFTGTFSLVVTATSTEAVTGGTASTSATLQVNVLTNVSPIVLDLNGDGIQTVALDASGGTFDLLNTGVAIHSGWLSPGDAFLAVDRNGNGIIDDRSELFGGALGEGFAQLSAYDSNQDGVVDARDAHFSDLLVWQDANGNHHTDPGELRTLTEAGIASLSVSYTFQPEQQNGNWLYERSSATMADGRTIAMADAYFQVEPSPGAVALVPKSPALSSHGATITVQSLLAARDSIIVPRVGRLDPPDRAHGSMLGLSVPSNLGETVARTARYGLKPVILPPHASVSPRQSPISPRLATGIETAVYLQRPGQAPSAPPTGQVSPPAPSSTVAVTPESALGMPLNPTDAAAPLIDWNSRRLAPVSRPPTRPLQPAWMGALLGVNSNPTRDLGEVTGLRVQIPRAPDRDTAI